MRTADHHAASQRVEVLLARAKVGMLAAHAHAARSLVQLLAERLPQEAVLSIYCSRQKLKPGDAHYVALHALARLPLPDESPSQAEGRALNGRSETDVDRLLSRGFRWLRDQVAPLADPELRALVETELARATTTLIVLHVRHALRFAKALHEVISAHAAVALYLDELAVDMDLRAAVYALAVTQASGQLPALPRGADMDTIVGIRSNSALQQTH
jgi:hypothetical protein